MRVRGLKRMSGLMLTLLVVTVVTAYAGLAWMRNSSIGEMAALAQSAHAGDRVESLIGYLESEAPPLDLKNRAIWVLGELRDERALETLQAMLVSEECDHDNRVCQREIRKAIRKITGEIPNPYL
jgi:HEAT repeat protein